MRTEISENGVIRVIVSRRNLETLLAKLNGDPPDSACTIIGPTVYPPTVLTAVEEETILLVEEDEVHYSHPSRLGIPAGVMHPSTEAAIKKEADGVLDEGEA